MRPSLRIGVDIDGVLADQTREILKMINERTNGQFTKRHVTAWDAKLGAYDIECEIESALERDPGYISRMRLVVNAGKCVQQLARQHELLAITHRDPSTREATEEWIRAKGLPIAHVEYTRGSSKAEVEADILIDDNPRNVEQFAETNGTAILFRQPWNRSYRTGHPKVHAANNWEDVVDIIGRLTKAQCPQEEIP